MSCGCLCSNQKSGVKPALQVARQSRTPKKGSLLQLVDALRPRCCREHVPELDQVSRRQQHTSFAHLQPQQSWVLMARQARAKCPALIFPALQESPIRLLVVRACLLLCLAPIAVVALFHPHGTRQWQDTAVALHNQHNARYTALLYLGTPPQPVRCIFDTGSSRTWISPKRFVASKSSSWRLLGPEAFQIAHFGTGSSLQGRLGSDCVLLEAPVGDSRCQFRIHFALNTEQSGAKMFDAQFGCLVGLAMLPRSARFPSSFINTIVSQAVLRMPAVSFYLSTHPAQTSALLIGMPDPIYFHPPLVYVDLDDNQSPFWQTHLLGVRVDTMLLPGESRRVVIDTGTSLLSGPSREVEWLRRAIRVDSNCVSISALPVIAFELNGLTLNLRPQHYVVRMWNRTTGAVACSLAISALDTRVPRWVLGNVFQRQYFVTFDAGSRRIGFARSKRRIIL